MNFVELFKDKFYFVGCDIEPAFRNGVEVKNTKFPKQVLEKVLKEKDFENNNDLQLNSWKAEYNSYALHTKCYAVRTGKISGITVLDFDSLYAYKKFCMNVPDFESYFTVRTKKGYHVYCLYNPELKTCNNVLKNLIEIIDIRNDPWTTNCGIIFGFCVLCPPSKYITLDGNNYSYEFLGGTIKPVPEYLFQCLNILKEKNIDNTPRSRCPFTKCEKCWPLLSLKLPIQM